MPNRPIAPSTRRPRALLAITLAAAATIATFAQSGDRSLFLGGEAAVAYPNFDIRTFKEDPAWVDKEDAVEYVTKFGAPQGLTTDLAVSRIVGVARLEAAYAGVVVEDSPTAGGIETVTASGKAFLTPASGNRVASLRSFIGANADAYGLNAAQVDTLEAVADYMNPAGNMGYAELEQRFNGIPVFQGTVRGGFTAKGELARTTGVLAQGIDASSLSTEPSLSAAQAVSAAASLVGLAVPDLAEQPSAVEGHVQFGPTRLAGEPSAWLTYFPLAPGVARLAWATQILGDPDGFLTVLDADDGTMLFRKNLTNYQTQAATYVVYSSDSPAPSSPTTATPDNHFQAPFVPRTTFTLIGNEAPNTFNNLGWMTDATNLTDGNNVEAGVDLVAPDGVDAPVPGAARVFDFPYDPQVDAPTTANYRNGDVTNMFYWVNRYHDMIYLLGFTEASRNFQTNNFGRGGVGNDRVRAEGQDFSGTNNANFQTPADGGRGRMQMYIWTGPTPDRSGDLDQDVIFHELTHGTSNRLHANGSGLSTNMSGGMGEGWSDFYARSLLSDASESVNGIYTIGGWVTREATGGFLDNYYYGIRRFPYAPRAVTGGAMNRPHSPLTFADIDSTQADLTDGAYPRGPFGSATVDQVHNIGEVWAGMLWEVRARFITRLGHAVGNQRLLQFVTDGMKLDPAGPTMLQARDAIIAAATAGGGTAADIADIWQGFATRGMGVLAQITNAGTGAGNTRVVESYLTPSDPVPSFSVSDVSQAEGNAGSSTFTFTVTLANPSAAESRVSFATADGTATAPAATTITAGTATTIPGAGTGPAPASPYPVPINVAGLTGTITKVAVRVNGLAHTFPDDIDMLLVGPGGQRSLFMSDIGGNIGIAGVNITFEDGAPAPPGALVSGTFAPADEEPGDAMSAPAPAGPYTTALSVFNGTAPNGTWNVFVMDDAGADIGSATGFSLLITTSTSPGDYQSAAGQLVFPPGTTSLPVAVPVNGDITVEPNETFTVNLTAPINGVIGDSQGVGTIVNDDGGVGSVPTTVNDAHSTVFHTPLIVPAPGVLGNDNSNGGGSMTAVLVSNPANGTLVFQADGSFVYTPNFAFAGTDTFTYRAVNVIGNGNVATVTITVTPPTNVQPPYNFRVESVVGNLVTLRWEALPIGPQASVFILEGGLLPGQVLASIPTGSASPIFTFVAPTGSFYIRMHGQLGADKSGPSNEIRLHVNVPVTPSAPTNLLGLVNGSTLGLTWKNTFGGGAPTGTILDVTGSAVLSLPMGATERFSFTPVPGGTYTFAVRSTNGGGSSPASSPVTLTFPGACSGAPQTPANFLAYRISNVGYVTWDPPAAGAAPTSYLLDVTGAFVGTFGTTGRALSGVIGPGSYNVRVQALNPCGASAFTPTQVITFP